MIIGHGIDLVDIKRFKIMSDQRLIKLSRKICVDSELIELKSSKDSYKYLAKIWSCKEAISKSFGTGLVGKNIFKKIIIITSDNVGKPIVHLKEPYNNFVCHLSLSNDRDYIIASAILETYV